MSRRVRKVLPGWVWLSVLANGVLAIAVLLLLRQSHRVIKGEAGLPPATGSMAWVPLAQVGSTQLSAIAAPPTPDIGPRHQLTYRDWLGILQQEAAVMATKQPTNLAILAGDSLSLWFPPDLLPTDYTWLNQGISGETSAGLRDRLALFRQVQPQVIFVMIGINDLIRGVPSETILRNQEGIIRDLQQQHPQAEIVVQSILPHSGEQATWEGREQLMALSNADIRQLNQALAVACAAAGVRYLDLHPLFVDPAGNLRSDLTTDGLHLNGNGYLVWRSALYTFSQIALSVRRS
ncbi:GDSL-type esterase/lipase family protein [Trichothermofontia sp.]